MDFETLFKIYYGLFRGESVAPDTTDPEWGLAVLYYNDAIQRLTKYDDTKWNFLYGTLQTAGSGTSVVSTGVTSYSAPTDMAEPGGMVKITLTNGSVVTLPLAQPYETQAINTSANYAYFTGDENLGLTLHLNPTPDATWNGASIDYVYYKKGTLLDSTTEVGTSIVIGGDASFIYQNMLAQRYRVNRNYPSYQIAKRDAEEALKGMKLKNNSGTHYSAWGVQDTGPGFGG